MNKDNIALSAETLQSLIDVVAPGSEVVSIHSLEGDFSNFTQLVKCKAPDGSLFQIVTRRYAVYGDYDRGEKARREFKILQLLTQHHLPVPDPLFLDNTGKILGSPGIVTRYVPGKLHLNRPYPFQWEEQLAKTLARIHTVPIDASDVSFLLDANSEVLWFLKSKETMPEYIRVHPKGEALWQAALDYLPRMKREGPTLVHIDYWSGNVLWDDGVISAVVDWEEAAQGAPGIDVAYCRMDMILCGMKESAEKFLAIYEKEIGHPVDNLGFWELAAAVRPMFNPDGWISESPSKERFAEFVDEAIEKSHCGK